MIANFLIEKFPGILVFVAADKEFCINIQKVLFVSSASGFLHELRNYLKKNQVPENDPYYVVDFNSIFKLKAITEKSLEKIIFIDFDDECTGIKVERVSEYIICDNDFYDKSEFVRISTHNYLRGKICYQDRVLYLPDYCKIIRRHFLKPAKISHKFNSYYILEGLLN